VRTAAAVAATALLAAGAAAASPAQSPGSYPSCGVHRAPAASPFVVPFAQYVCLDAARRAGKKARAAIVSTTIEGDPIVTYVFVRGRWPVLVVVDATRDDFGPGVWIQRRCDRMAFDKREIGFAGCTTIRRGKPSWLKPIPIR
jgi:hypothetical protein